MSSMPPRRPWMYRFFLHPTSPPSIKPFLQYRLTPIAGFPFDTTLAATQLVLSGTMAAFPDLKIVLGNLGGTVPFLAGRIDQGYISYPEASEKLDRPPSAYLRNMYYESAGMPKRRGASPGDRIRRRLDRVMFGSDFPQQIADVDPGSSNH